MEEKENKVQTQNLAVKIHQQSIWTKCLHL